MNPGTVTRSGTQFGKQIVATFFCAAYSVIATVILLKGINLFIPIVPDQDWGLGVGTLPRQLKLSGVGPGPHPRKSFGLVTTGHPQDSWQHGQVRAW